MAIVVGKGSPLAGGNPQRALGKSESKPGSAPTTGAATTNGKESATGSAELESHAPLPQPTVRKPDSLFGAAPAVDAPPRQIFRKADGVAGAAPALDTPPRSILQKPVEAGANPVSGGGQSAISKPGAKTEHGPVSRRSLAPQPKSAPLRQGATTPSTSQAATKTSSPGAGNGTSLGNEAQAAPPDARTVGKHLPLESGALPAAQSVKLARAAQVLAAHKQSSKPEAPRTTRKV